MSATPSISEPILERLFAAGQLAVEEYKARDESRFDLFIPCDHRGAYEALRAHRSRATTFLELGNAAGIVTIMADLLGFDAYGIEIEPWLVTRSIEIAEAVGSSAVFAEGTFVPVEYQDEVSLLSGDYHTPTNGVCGYEELGLDLSDFDLVFSYPWPGDEDWLRELVRRHGRTDAILLTYAVSEGFEVIETS